VCLAGFWSRASINQPPLFNVAYALLVTCVNGGIFRQWGGPRAVSEQTVKTNNGRKKRKRRESEEARKYADSLRVGRAVAFPNGNVERNRAI
jgi:hypothetical protein